jgi:hypothetical protein
MTNIRNNILFVFLLGLTAIFVAGNAAYFSITGLSRFFGGAVLPVIIMASSLELGKLVTASFLYRYWPSLNLVMRTYLTACVVVLVLITSTGIFGFLSNAYQSSTVDLEQHTLSISLMDERLEQLKEDKLYLQNELVAQLEEMPENYATARRNLREQYSTRILNTSTNILDLSAEVNESKQKLLETGVDVGPLLYVAKALDMPLDIVATWLILILISVFDPLAVALVIALNIATGKRLEKKEKPKEEPLPPGQLFPREVTAPVHIHKPEPETEEKPEIEFQEEAKNSFQPY